MQGNNDEDQLFGSLPDVAVTTSQWRGGGGGHVGVGSVLPGRVQRQQDRWKLQVQIFSCTLAGWGRTQCYLAVYRVSRTAGSCRYRYLAVHWRGGEGSVLPGRVQSQQDRWKLQVQIFSCTLAGRGRAQCYLAVYSVSRTVGSCRYRYLAVHWRGGQRCGTGTVGTGTGTLGTGTF